MVGKNPRADICEFYHGSRELEGGGIVYNYHCYSPRNYGALLDVSHLALNSEEHLVNLLDRVWTNDRPVVIRSEGRRFEGRGAEQHALAFIKEQLLEFVAQYRGKLKDCEGLEQIFNRSDLWKDSEPK